MRKILLIVFCFTLVLSVSAQRRPELIVIGVAGTNKTDSTFEGNFGSLQGRLMFGDGLRIGPFLAYTQYASTELQRTPNPALLGKEFNYGLSVDAYGKLAYTYSFYCWINSGIKNVTDRYSDGSFESITKTNEIFASGGLFITDDWQGWFGNNRIMFDYQKPLNSEIRGTWRSQVNGVWTKTPIKNLKPYNKESYRIVLVSGIKRFGKGTVNFEPAIHFGYGQDFGRSKNNSYYEYGGGLSFGLMREWYHNILELKIVKRNYFNAESRLGFEMVFSPSSLVQSFKKTK